jgi:hypothetical protein
MTEFRLLAVVEVPQADRVVCQAPGCKHPVYKRIHVVQEDGRLTVLGSECFKKLFGEGHSAPSYGSGADGGTNVLAVHVGLPPGVSSADNETGWRMALAKLAAFVEPGGQGSAVRQGAPADGLASASPRHASGRAWALNVARRTSQ